MNTKNQNGRENRFCSFVIPLKRHKRMENKLGSPVHLKQNLSCLISRHSKNSELYEKVSPFIKNATNSIIKETFNYIFIAGVVIKLSQSHV